MPWFTKTAACFFALVLVTAVLLAIHNAYLGAIRLELWGLRFSSTGVFRPALVAVVSWLALGRLVPAFRPSENAQIVSICLLIYCLSSPVFVSGDVIPASGDVTPTEYTALSLASGSGTSLDGYPELVKNGLPYFVTATPHGLRSSYPIGASFLAWPVFVPMTMMNEGAPELADRLGQLAAMGIGLAGIGLALRIVRRLDPPFSPALLVLAYALGTSHWSTSSFALWQHGAGELWVLGALERLTDRDSPLVRRLPAAGACISLAVFSRPTLAVSAVLLLLLAAQLYRRRASVVVLAAITMAVPLVSYQQLIYGSWLGGYASQAGTVHLSDPGDMLEAAYWLWVSPSRGMVFYEPVVLFTLCAALWIGVRKPASITLISGLVGFFAFLGIYANWPIWWGGHCFGPRLMTDALPWWLLATASIGRQGPAFLRVTAGLTLWGVVANSVGASGLPDFWDGHPSVDWFPDRLESVVDSQLMLGLLASVPGENRVAAAIEEDRSGHVEEALSLWREEWSSRPWNRFAASRVADLLLRSDRIDEAITHARRMSEMWPNYSYARHLEGRLPTIRRMLQEDWRHPLEARSSRNGDAVSHVIDGCLGTQWSTVWHQRRTDWLELDIETDLKVRGIALFSAPDFSSGPSGLTVTGTRASGESVLLGTLGQVRAPHKGWVVVRFPPRRLRSVRVNLLRDATHSWTISEARVLTDADAPPS